MTPQEYEQKKRECWDEFCKSNGLYDQVYVLVPTAFNYAFDRAYALGKQEKNTVIQGWVCRDKKDDALNLHAEEPYRTQKRVSDRR